MGWKGVVKLMQLNFGYNPCRPEKYIDRLKRLYNLNLEKIKNG